MSNLSKVILGTGNYYDVKSGNTVSVTGDGGMLGDILDQHIKN